MAPSSRSPGLTRFLSDFTLGFSDGLTVPFALTAGLSSLGRADTVIYAGMAELCAGSISMGIGGYLAALDELPAETNKTSEGGDEEELKGMLHSAGSSDDGSRESSDEKMSAQEQLVMRHLEPLELPGSAVANILSSLREQPGRLDRAANQLESRNNDALCQQPQQLPIWPVASGLSISLGYVVGGIIPLLPYFFAATVGLGLAWSIGLCLVALMAFGSGKSWILGGEDATWKRSLWSGMQMLVLGSLAAGAAVLCVQLVGASDGEGGA